MDSPRVVMVADDHWTSICYGNGSRITATLASVKAREKALFDKKSRSSSSSSTTLANNKINKRFPLLSLDDENKERTPLPSLKLRYRVRPEAAAGPPVQRVNNVNVDMAAREASGTPNRNAYQRKESRQTQLQSNDKCLKASQTHHPTTTIMKGNEQNERPTRSRAIAIERTNRLGSSSSNEDNEPTCSTEQMYDYATWRMYNRITDHRRRYPIRYLDSAAAAGQPSSDSDEEGRGQESEAKDGTRCDRVRHPQEREDDFLFDGEVFDLEL